jgi:hypothetical protein
MALIACTECGKQISDTASACVGCGAPTEGTRQAQVTHVKIVRPGAKWERTGFLIIAMGVLMISFGERQSQVIGGFGVLIGLVVFIIGRFK